jgi:hypothetical protein
VKRRKFIAGLGSAAAVWPAVVRAQRGERVRRVGVLKALAETDPEGSAVRIHAGACTARLDLWSHSADGCSLGWRQHRPGRHVGEGTG